MATRTADPICRGFVSFAEVCGAQPQPTIWCTAAQEVIDTRACYYALTWGFAAGAMFAAGLFLIGG